MSDSDSRLEIVTQLFFRTREKLSGSPLVSRLSWGIALGFILLHLVSGVYQVHQSLLSQASQMVVSIAERARVIDELTVNRSDRVDALDRISDDNFSISLALQPAALPAEDERWHSEVLVRDRAETGLKGLGFRPDEVQFAFVFRRREPRLLLSIPASASGGDNTQRWLLVKTSAQPARWQRHAAALIWTSLLALLILGIVLWATRRFTRLLPAFVTAAERVGSMNGADPLPEEGPRELRRLSIAFNTMQEKIQAHEQERRTMLGAVSHDLRTLVTRLSLRMEHVEALPAREKIQDDLESMTRIVDEALAFSRDESSDEPFVKLELLSLVQTVVDARNESVAFGNEPFEPAAVDIVAGVFGKGEPSYVSGQAVALKRALLNVVDNAVLYGGDVVVQLWQEPKVLVVLISDGGAGIPPADERRVLQPYVRLEASRNRATGGTGLGLTIASNVINRHHGNMSFVRVAGDDVEGGQGRPAGQRFGVRIELPLFS